MNVRGLVILYSVLCLAACRIEVNVPANGDVVTESGAYSCNAGQSCVIDVSDTYFHETFVAEPHDGYIFSGWTKDRARFCGGSLAPCTLSTTGFAEHANLMAVLESDEVFYLEPTFIMSDAIRRYQLGDAVSFTGTLSVEEPSQPVTITQINAKAEFLRGTYSYADKEVLKLRTTVTDTVTGEASSSSIHLWQEENGAFFILNDNYGNYYWDAGRRGYGLASIPAPLVVSSNTVMQFYTLLPGHTSGPLTIGTRKVTVGAPQKINVAMGSYITYPVVVSDNYSYVSSYADNKRDSSIDIKRSLWVSQEKGVVRAIILRREYSSSGKLERTSTLNIKAVKSTF